MSYTPTNWQTGDTVTATKLNKIEQGIAGAGSALICTSSYDGDPDTYVLDKTAQEIYDALLGGTPVYIKYQYGSPETYSGAMYLAPIIAVVNYNYAAMIRFIASKPKRQQFNSIYYNYSAGELIYQATALNAYPTFVTATGVNVSAMVTSDIEDLV